MNKERVFPLSVKKLGKLDEIVLQHGKNNDDGWGYTTKPDSERFPFPARKPSKHWLCLSRWI